MTAAKHYRAVLQRNLEMLSALEADEPAFAEFTKVHNLVADAEKLSNLLDGRPERVLIDLAIREFNFALVAASSAHYRHAHISLRLFFELALTAVHFSAHEINLRRWIANSKDIIWSSLVDADEGVFAVNFVKAFGSGLEENAAQYRTMAEKVYRECSEFVHGNLHTHQDPPGAIDYDRELLLAWANRASATWLAFLFAYCSRYLKFFQKRQLKEIEFIVLDNFGHMVPVQQIYGK
jgi:hypothetical protein